MSKYDPLVEHFRRLTGTSWHATFADIERIVGFQLPASARTYPAWWANSADNMPQKGAWLAAGWRTRDLNLSAGHLNAEFLRALSAGWEISVAAVISGAWIDGGGSQVAADMSSVTMRCLLENAAILADGAMGIESLNQAEAINSAVPV